jgi:deoxyribonuclease (pyrimidine dimer)
VTRINVGVQPEELPSKLLLAEHREITRVPNAVRTGRAKLQGIPTAFTLGTGHVKFFYRRLGFLKQRYEALYAECCNRGFGVTNKANAFTGLPATAMGDYSPTHRDRQLIVDRIESKGFKLQPRNA